MTPEQHRRAVTIGTIVGGAGLMGALTVQLVLRTDFHGMPFLAYAVWIGLLAASLLVRAAFMRAP